MDTDTGALMRSILGIPEGQTVSLWEFPGIKGCPLAFHQEEQGLANCPLGFERQEVPHQPEPWIRDLCEDETSEQRWRQILAKCELCQGKPRLSSDEVQRLQRIQELLFRKETK
jgi:hypothetical protein